MNFFFISIYFTLQYCIIMFSWRLKSRSFLYVEVILFLFLEKRKFPYDGGENNMCIGPERNSPERKPRPPPYEGSWGTDLIKKLGPQ